MKSFVSSVSGVLRILCSAGPTNAWKSGIPVELKVRYRFCIENVCVTLCCDEHSHLLTDDSVHSSFLIQDVQRKTPGYGYASKNFLYRHWIAAEQLVLAAEQLVLSSSRMNAT